MTARHLRPAARTTVALPVAAIAAMLTVTACRTPPPDGGSATAPGTSSGILVRGTGATEYTVLDEAGAKVHGSARTNVAMPLAPGKYVVRLNGSKRPVTLGGVNQMSLSAGSIVVSATDGADYTLHAGAAAGYLSYGKSGASLELLPGDYVVGLNGSRQPITIREGQPLSVSPGHVIVRGLGADDYTVREAASDRYLTYRRTNAPMALLPGTYVVGVNGTRQRVTVLAGQEASLTAGRIVVTGQGADDYTVTDAASNAYLTYRKINAPLEVFAGSYVVGVNGSTQTTTVQAGEETRVAAGELLIRARAADEHFYHDASGAKYLGRVPAAKPMELLPGQYVVESKARGRRSVTVAAGRRTTLE